MVSGHLDLRTQGWNFAAILLNNLNMNCLAGKATI